MARDAAEPVVNWLAARIRTLEKRISELEKVKSPLRANAPAFYPQVQVVLAELLPPEAEHEEPTERDVAAERGKLPRERPVPEELEPAPAPVEPVPPEHEATLYTEEREKSEGPEASDEPGNKHADADHGRVDCRRDDGCRPCHDDGLSDEHADADHSRDDRSHDDGNRPCHDDRLRSKHDDAYHSRDDRNHDDGSRLCHDDRLSNKRADADHIRDDRSHDDDRRPCHDDGFGTKHADANHSRDDRIYDDDGSCLCHDDSHGNEQDDASHSRDDSSHGKAKAAAASPETVTAVDAAIKEAEKQVDHEWSRLGHSQRVEKVRAVVAASKLVFERALRADLAARELRDRASACMNANNSRGEAAALLRDLESRCAQSKEDLEQRKKIYMEAKDALRILEEHGN